MTASLQAVDRRLPGIGGFARATIVIFGAMAVLQSSQGLDAVKLAYLGAATLAVGGSVWSVYRERADALVAFARPWLVASLVVAGIIGISLPVALLHGTAFSTWTRDAAAYALVVAAPWVALDLARSVTSRTMIGLTVLAGGLAALSYAIVWVQRRAITDVAIDRLVLPSFTLATALFAVAVAQSVSREHRRYWWAALASVTVALLLLAGTRTALAILIVPLVIIAIAWLTDRSLSFRTRIVPACLPLLTAGVIVASTQLSLAVDLGHLGGPLSGSDGSGSSDGSRSPPDPHTLEGRFDTFGSVLAGRDASLQDRVAQTRAAWDIFLASPLVGSGLGVVVPWTTTSGRLETEFTADTPVLVLAKFGVLGLVLVGALGGAWLITIRRLNQGGPSARASRLALAGFGAAIVALTPFGWQLEDKGTGLAVILILGLALSEAGQADLVRRRRGQEA